MRIDTAARIGAVLIALAALCGWSCGRHAALPVATTTGSRPATAANGDASVYDLDVPLVDADGRASALSDLRGRVVVATMIYTNCATVCPRVTEDMKAIVRRLPAGARAGTVFAFFSLDPGHDTPDTLRRFAAQHELEGVPWRLFGASADDVRSLAAVLGVKYAPLASGEIAHSGPIVVIDRAGVARYRQAGLAAGSDDMVQSILAAAAHP